MGLYEREELANNEESNPQSFQVQTKTIWACINSGMGGNGYNFSGAGQTYTVWEIFVKKSSQPMGLKLYGGIDGMQPKVQVKFHAI